jgi:hypothetical protein
VETTGRVDTLPEPYELEAALDLTQRDASP